MFSIQLGVSPISSFGLPLMELFDRAREVRAFLTQRGFLSSTSRRCLMGV